MKQNAASLAQQQRRAAQAGRPGTSSSSVARRSSSSLAARIQLQQQQRPLLAPLRAAEDTSTTTTTTTAPPQEAAGSLLELTKETFHAHLEAAGDSLVIVDFYTQWCGPCKLIYPELVKLSEELSPAATIVKFDCNQHNKELAKSLGIRVAPTFHLYRKGQKVAEMTGAKVDRLRALIDEQLAGGAAN